MFKKFAQLVVIVVCMTALLYPFFQPPTEVEPQKSSESKTPKKRPVKEKPLHNVKLPDFAAIKNVRDKKAQFFDFIRKPIEQANARIRQQRAQLEIAAMMFDNGQALPSEQQDAVKEIFEQYNVKGEISELSLALALRRVDVVPKELVMIQAANESAWGTSRFARIGLNFFGQWCFSDGCGLVPRRRDEGANHEVAVYQSVKEAVDAYFYNINTHNAYRELRDIRFQLRQQQQPIDAKSLSFGLMAYSERGEAYIEELQAMMDHNKAYF